MKLTPLQQSVFHASTMMSRLTTGDVPLTTLKHIHKAAKAMTPRQCASVLKRWSML